MNISLVGVTRKLRRILFVRRYKDVLIFLSFLFVSAAFWLFLALGEENQIELEVPLRLNGVPHNAVVTSELPSKIRVQVKDRSIELLAYRYGITLRPVVIEWSEYESQGLHPKVLMADVQRKVASQLMSSTRIMQIKPDTLDFIYTYGTSKRVPVVFDGEIETGSQFYVVKMEFSPDSVLAYAPQDQLSQIREAATKKILRSNVTDTITFMAELRSPKGVKYSPDRVRAKCFVDMFTEKTVDVPVEGEGFPNGYVLRTFPSKVRLTFQVGVKEYNSVDASSFKVVVKYADVKDGGHNDKCTPQVISMPQAVRRLKVSPDKIDYLIERKLWK